MAWLSGQCGRFWGSLSACRDAFSPAAQCTPFPGTCLAELLLAGDDAQRVISSLVITLTNLTLERVVDGLGCTKSLPHSRVVSPIQHQLAWRRASSAKCCRSFLKCCKPRSCFQLFTTTAVSTKRAAVHRCEKEPRRSLARPPARPLRVARLVALVPLSLSLSSRALVAWGVAGAAHPLPELPQRGRRR
jgi:hypothetical protein